MPARFANKTVVVTGASFGLGRCLSWQLAGEGANLILFARNEAALHDTAQACLEKASAGRRHTAQRTPQVVVGDITNVQDCQRLAQLTTEHGGVDYLLNCAGISMWMRFSDMQDLDALEQVMQTNYFGAIRMIHCLLPQLRQKRGLICAISSLQGYLPAPWHSGYTASKHALDGFLNTLRLEQSEVDILSVHPTWISGTQLREHAVGDAPRRDTLKNNAAVSADRCAKQILNAMHRRRRELTVPARYRLLPLLYAVWPTLLEGIICRRVRRQFPSDER